MLFIFVPDTFPADTFCLSIPSHSGILLIEDSPCEDQPFLLALAQTVLDVAFNTDGLFSLSR
jgi:hypothetical protein